MNGWVWERSVCSFFAAFGCHTDEFQCLMDGLCIPLRWRCDGDTDCMDMSDEKECEGVTHMCDPAVNDCEDNSDEENCEALVCKLSHHVCANDSTICLPAEKLCDGTDDCPDGSDEKLCGEKQQFPHCASEQGSHNGKDNNLNHSLLIPISQTSAPWTTVASMRKHEFLLLLSASSWRVAAARSSCCLSGCLLGTDNSGLIYTVFSFPWIKATFNIQ
uniref:Uncharacterized protein n=1 Tax=Oryzias latipes TaxID=8090 RepID=A0A3P9L4U0_ORYLA